MLKQKARAIALGVLGGELALTVLSLPVAYLLRHGVLAPFLPSMYPVALPFFEEIWAVAKVAFGGTAILTLLVYGLRVEFVSRWLLAVFAVVNFFLLAGERVALRSLSRWVRSRGYNFRTVLLVGTGPKASQL